MDMNRAFPHIVAVDPTNCGCTECIVGEYVPLQDYLERANAHDLMAIIEEDVTLHTYAPSVLDFILNECFQTESAQRFVVRFHDTIEDELKSMSFSHLVEDSYY